MDPNILQHKRDILHTTAEYVTAIERHIEKLTLDLQQRELELFIHSGNTLQLQDQQIDKLYHILGTCFAIKEYLGECSMPRLT